MTRRLIVAVGMSLLASTTDAQIIRRVGPERPNAWAAFSVGLFQSGTVTDGTTGSTWDFGDAMQYRVALEKAMQGTTTVGVAATFARVPLTYQSDAGSTACGVCDAHANVTQLYATLHNGGASLGFYQVVDIDVGATIYSNFRRTDDVGKLDPGSDTDLAFDIGYGFGFALSPNTRVELVQQFGASIHQRENLSGSASTAVRSSVTRLGVRFGLGQQR